MIGKNVKNGDVVCFGHYAYGADGEVAPVEWQVLAVREDKALLVSKYCVEWWRFHRPAAVIWKDSEVRDRLKFFFEEAFTAEEATCILKNTIRTSEACCYDDEDDFVFMEDTGVETADHLFLLSLWEAQQYFKNDAARRAIATPYACSQGAYVNEAWHATGWWLRNRGYGISYASDVLPDGSLCGTGDEVYEESGIRPAMWVNL